MLFQRVIISSDADPRVVATVKRNLSGYPIECIEVENPEDAFVSSESIHRSAKETLVLRARRSSFTKRFDAVPEGSICSRFWQLTPELQCLFACHYCYLEKTLRYPHLMLPTHFTNYDRMFRDIERVLIKTQKPTIFNLGELADSRALDHITEFSKTIVPFITSTPNGYLHMLSKSRNYENFLSLDACDRNGVCRVIQVASVNAQPVIDAVEEKTGSLSERVTAIANFATAGYRIRYRFDPLMFVGDLFGNRGTDPEEDIRATKRMYAEMMDVVFSLTKPEMVTLGTYRPSVGLQRYIRKRYPHSPILKVETSLDKGKERVDEGKRVALYRWFIEEIRRRSPGTVVALCKETPEVWGAVGIKPTPLECSCLLFAGERKTKFAAQLGLFA